MGTVRAEILQDEVMALAVRLKRIRVEGALGDENYNIDKLIEACREFNDAIEDYTNTKAATDEK